MSYLNIDEMDEDGIREVVESLKKVKELRKELVYHSAAAGRIRDKIQKVCPHINRMMDHRGHCTCELCGAFIPELSKEG